ncbi:hypothetical protein ACVR1G_02215 [Streptococcus dentasini]
MLRTLTLISEDVTAKFRILIFRYQASDKYKKSLPLKQTFFTASLEKRDSKEVVVRM